MIVKILICESFLPCEFSFVSAQLLQHPVPGVYVLPSDASALSEFLLLLLLLFIIVTFMLKPECCLSLSSLLKYGTDCCVCVVGSTEEPCSSLPS